MKKRHKTFKKSKLFGFVKAIGSLFMRKAKLVYTDGEIPKQAIFLTTHGIKPLIGIMKNELSMPKNLPFVTIGTHELCNPYFKRLRYGLQIHYRMRNGWGPVKAFLWSSIVAFYLGMMYKMARVIPSYRDLRSLQTMRESFRAFDEGYSVLIYPEDLEHMYNNVYIKFLPGFVFMAQQYYEKTGKDMPVVPCYFSAQFNRIIFGKPLSVVDMLKEGKTREEIADHFRVIVNGLYADHIQPLVKAKEAKYSKFNDA